MPAPQRWGARHTLNLTLLIDYCFLLLSAELLLGAGTLYLLGLLSTLDSGHLVLCCAVAQSCPTLCDPLDCSPPGSSVHGILQARILEWVAMASSRGCSQPRDQTQVSRIAGGFFIIWAPGNISQYSCPFFSWNWTLSCICVESWVEE